jgi:hypothetical protein
MPGITEAHAHLSWPSSVERFVPGMDLPPEDMLLNTARNARILLDHGFTSAYSAAILLSFSWYGKCQAGQFLGYLRKTDQCLASQDGQELGFGISDKAIIKPTGVAITAIAAP